MITEMMSYDDMDDNLLNKLAKLLKLTREELDEIEPEIHPDESDGAVVSYTVLFKDGASKDILNKIPNLQDGDSVSVGIYDINEPEKG